MLLLLLLGFGAYAWSGLSPRALICFDRTGLENGIEYSAAPIPIDYGLTLVNCLGPVGWIVGLGVFGFALATALTVCRCRWPSRVIAAAAPIVLAVYAWASTSDLHPWVRPVVLRILVAEALVAVSAAVLCRPVKRLLLAVWQGGPPPAVRVP